MKEVFYEYFAVKRQSYFMDNTEQGLFDLQMDPTAVDALKDGARWAKFISVFFLIIMLLAIGVIIISLPFLKSALPDIEANMNIPYYIIEWVYPLMVVVIVIAAVSFYAYYKLYAFAVNAKRGATELDQHKLELSVAHLKVYMKLLAILGILGLAINVAAAVVVFTTIK